MPFIVAGLTAIVALTGGILANVDPASCIARAVLAFFLGWIAAQVWQLILIQVGFRGRKEGPAEKSIPSEELPAA